MVDALVRPALPGDADVLAALQLGVWQQAYAELLPASVVLADPAEHSVAWSRRITDGGPVLLAFEGSQPVGFAAAESDLDDERHGQIELLHVLPRWSRRGHGGRLLSAVAARLRSMGAERGHWWAPETDESVQQFLLGVSWKPDGPRRVLDTGEGTFAEIRYAGNLDLIAI